MQTLTSVFGHTTTIGISIWMMISIIIVPYTTTILLRIFRNHEFETSGDTSWRILRFVNAIGAGVMISTFCMFITTWYSYLPLIGILGAASSFVGVFGTNKRQSKNARRAMIYLPLASLVIMSVCMILWTITVK